MSFIPISKPNISLTEKKAVMEVLESGNLAQGARTAEFEQRFAQLCSVRHAVAVSSGTSALFIALISHEIGPGDEVITTPFTFIATVNSILFVGAKPVFVDIEEETFNINPALVEVAITPRTKAILPVHLYGHICNMEDLGSIAHNHNLVIIEDACQAVLATYKGIFAGNFGTGAFSFYATKNLMMGEGGIITTSDDEIAERCRLLRNHGMKTRYHHEMLGFNFRLTDLQAAIGLAQLDRISDFNAKRSANAAFYSSALKSVITPKVREGYQHAWHQYTVRLKNGRDRNDAVTRLRETGIGAGIYYPVPAHKQPHVRDIVGEVSLPVAERLAEEVFSIPVHPSLSQRDLEKIVSEVNRL